MKHFFEMYPPKDTEYKAIYEPPPPHSLLSLSIDSTEPELVWMVLDKQLAKSEDVSAAWARVSSGASTKKSGLKIETEQLEEIRIILKVLGGFTPPPTPKVTATAQEDLRSSSNPQAFDDKPLSNKPPPNSQRSRKTPSRGNGKGRGRGRGRGRGKV